MPLSPLVFDPIFKEKVWGGQGLGQKLDKPIPADVPIGESWEISAVPGDESIARSGPYAGKTLPEICAKDAAGLLGDISGGSTAFPLLYKFIDANDNLSIQVHPNDMQAQALSMGAIGKTECWYIVDAKPGMELICGFKKGIRLSDVKNALQSNTLPSLCNYLAVKPGDVVFVPAGTVHATLAGALLYEVQQTSDTTFRLYDWERKGPDGKPRALHIDAALGVLDLTYHTRHIIEPIILAGPGAIGHSLRVACRYFALEEYTFQGHEKLTLPAKRSFWVITVLDGSLTISSFPAPDVIAQGGSMLIPASNGALRCAGRTGAHFLVSYVPDLESEIISPLRQLHFSDDTIEMLGGNPSKNDLKPLL
jgi:mannose-6-phosphate isomerase